MTSATSPMTTRAAELCYKSTRDPARPPIADRLRWPAVPGVPSYPSSSTDSRGVHVSRAVQCSAVRRAAWRRRWPPAMLAWRPTPAPPATAPTPVRTTKTSFPPVYFKLIVTINYNIMFYNLYHVWSSLTYRVGMRFYYNTPSRHHESRYILDQLIDQSAGQ